MKPALYFCLLAILTCRESHSEVYKCLAENGRISFSQTPCLDTEEKQIFKPSPITTKYKDIKIIQPNSNKTNIRKKEDNNSCPHIGSTELRNLRVKQQYTKGLPEKEIVRRFGKAHSIITNSTDTSTWEYKSDSYKLEFTFKHGCLKKWKEKWHREKSRIDKYREF